MPSKRHRLLPQPPSPRVPPEDLVERRNWEQDKYRRVYGEFPQYGTGLARLTRFVNWAKGRGIRSLLDIGAGRGEILNAAAREPLRILATKGYEVVESLCGMDVADPSDIERGYHKVEHFPGMHAIPEEDNSWDWVSCCDVLEHVQEEDARAGLREMIRVAQTGLYLTISWAEDAWGRNLGPGEILHINRKPGDWWIDELEVMDIDSINILRSSPGALEIDLEILL